MSEASSKTNTFVEILRQRAAEDPQKIMFTFLADGEVEEVPLTFEKLDQRAKALAGYLKTRASPGDRILLLYPTHPDFIISFFGILYAQMVAVPLPPPDPSRPDQSFPQFIKIARDAEAHLLLTNQTIWDMACPFLSHAPELKKMDWVVTDSIEAKFADEGKEEFPSPKSLALLLYTSGSTGHPKGVMIRHDNLMSMALQISQIFQWPEQSRNVSWLPLYHNFGLVTTVLEPMYSHYSSFFMSPLSFLQRPFRWLKAIDRHRANISAGSNFAFDLCLNQIQPQEKELLDLKCWIFAVCGSERIHPRMLKIFFERFEPCGFQASSFYPGYGLSEATSVVAVRRKLSPVSMKCFSQMALGENRIVETSAKEEVLELIGCGPPLPDQKIVIVSPDSRSPCPLGEMGEIWVSGPCVTQGYWNKPQETEETFQGYLKSGEGPFLRTGDLGFLSREGELFITGRLKEVLIIRGHNHYPQDLEQTLEKLSPLLREGYGAAFSVEVEGEETLVIAYEVEPSSEPEKGWETIIDDIRGCIAKNHGIQVHAIVLMAPGSLPKTRLGKVQRKACREAYLGQNWKIIKKWQEKSGARKLLFGERSSFPIPQTAEEIEEWWIHTVSQITGRDPKQIHLKKPLTVYGLDSLRSVEISQAIERDLGIPLLIASLFESPSQEKILEDLQSRFSSPGHRPKKKIHEELDLPSEAVLSPSLSFSKNETAHDNTPSSLFLTGGTGFLGAFLLEEILRKTKARIFCLVRAPDEKTGLKRIRENLEFFNLWNDRDALRIQPVCGDLSKPFLSLSEADFETLAEEVDAIYHNGAVVNFIFSYRDLKFPNVLGTQEVIRLAGLKRTKPLHYISTLSVFPTAGHPRGEIFREDDALTLHQGLLNGYAQSKWVAEKLLMEAKSRGLPLTVFRVGEVIGHSQTGACRATQDAYSLLMRGCIQLKMAPRMNLLLYFVPVNYVAGSIVHLSQNPQSLGKAFHLTNPQAISTEELFDLIRSLGYPFQSVSFEEWVEAILRSTQAGEKNIIKSFLPFLRGETVLRLGSVTTRLQIDCQETLRALKGSNLQCPLPNETLFKPYLSYLRRSGFLQA